MRRTTAGGEEGQVGKEGRAGGRKTSSSKGLGSESTCQAPWRQLEGPDALRTASPPHGTMITPKLSSASADELFHTFGHSVTLGVAFSCSAPSCVHDFLLEGRAREDYT